MLEFLKRNAMLSVISSVLFLILGIIFILNPSAVTTFISYIFGLSFILVGIVKIITYFSNKSNIYNFELIIGIVALAIGIFVITCSSTISALFRIIIGIWIIYTGILRFVSSIRLKEVDIKMWPFLLIMSIVMIIAGVYVVLNSGTLIISIGAIVVIYAIMDLIESITFYVNLSKM
jgi:uncharacterized membrane protein HdeD (DUF308 family)